MKKIIGLCLVAVFAVALVGCGGAPVKPDWVTKGSGAYPGDPFSKIYGVGIAGVDPNPAVQKKQASTRAREELANSIRVSVKGFVKDFMQSHKDWFDLNNTAGSDELFTSVTVTLTDESLMMSKQLNAYEDPQTGTLYVLYAVDLDNKFYDTYKSDMKKVLREKHGAVVAEKADKAIAEMDAAIADQRAHEKDIISGK